MCGAGGAPPSPKVHHSCVRGFERLLKRLDAGFRIGSFLLPADKWTPSLAL